MLETNYKRLEKIVIFVMIVGIIAMFQPWFRSMVELFDPLTPDTNLGRNFRQEIAPIIFRYGFYATFLSTVAFIIISHYDADDLRQAFREKGVPLTILLIFLPVVYGFVVIGHLAWAEYDAALLGVINVTCAIATWNWKRWGPIGLGLTALVELGLAFSDLSSRPIAVTIFLAAIVLVALIWPKRAKLQ